MRGLQSLLTFCESL